MKRDAELAQNSANVKNEKQYEKLKDKGMSKSRAARIANSPGSSSRGGKKSGSGSSSKQGGTSAQKMKAGALGQGSRTQEISLGAGLVLEQLPRSVVAAGRANRSSTSHPARWAAVPSSGWPEPVGPLAAPAQEADFSASRTASRVLSRTAANGPATMLAAGVLGVDGWGRVGAAFLAAA